MTNMRRGFTMIELVFVIVIIGILAAVALPRFTGISEDARVSKLTSFVGTLNRSVGPSVWSGLQRDEPTVNGSVAGATAAKYNSLGTDQSALLTDGQLQSIPAELFDGGLLSDETSLMDLTSCAAAGSALPAVGAAVAGAALAAQIANSVTIGTAIYAVGCIDSNLNQSPRFYLFNITDGNRLIIK